MRAQFWEYGTEPPDLLGALVGARVQLIRAHPDAPILLVYFDNGRALVAGPLASGVGLTSLPMRVGPQHEVLLTHFDEEDAGISERFVGRPLTDFVREFIVFDDRAVKFTTYSLCFLNREEEPVEHVDPSGLVN